MTEATKTVTIKLERDELVDLCIGCVILREKWDKLSLTLNKQLAKFDLDQ